MRIRGEETEGALFCTAADASRPHIFLIFDAFKDSLFQRAVMCGRVRYAARGGKFIIVTHDDAPRRCRFYDVLPDAYHFERSARVALARRAVLHSGVVRRV